jgi:uncharacterized protein (DUF2062 family)
MSYQTLIILLTIPIILKVSYEIGKRQVGTNNVSNLNEKIIITLIGFFKSILISAIILTIISLILGIGIVIQKFN